MQFTSKQGDTVTPERWQWIADYGNGSGIRQFDYQNIQYHYFGEIDHGKTKKFGLIQPETGKHYIIDIPEGAKLIHFYDNIIQQPIGGEQVAHKLYCFGYETESTKRVLVMLPNDFIIEADPEKIAAV